MMIVRRLLANSLGGVAFSFALLIPTMLAGMSLAVDYSMYRIDLSRLQTAVDAGALSAVNNDKATPAEMTAAAVQMVNWNVPADFGTVTTTSDITVGKYATATGFVADNKVGANAIRVTAIRSAERGNAPNRILSQFLGNFTTTISATAVAARPDNIFYEPPEVTKLDSEAWDFNELYAYCYDYAAAGTPASKRSGMTLVSNNSRPGVNVASFPKTKAGDKIKAPPNPLVWPECKGATQSLSFRLRNFISANQTNSLFSTTTENNYYSDTTVTNGIETSALIGDLIETVLCDTAAKCDPSSSGTIIPKGRNRTPTVAKTACEPGKYMYFGWEDRPPKNGGSDKDFDDLTIRLRCPRNGKLGDTAPRLVG